MRFSCHALFVEVQTNHRYFFSQKFPEIRLYCFNLKGDNFSVKQL